MLKAHWIFLPLFLTASAGFGQSLLEKAANDGGVVMSTDPEIAAQVESKVADLIAARQQEGQPQTSGTSGDATTGATSKSSAGTHKRKSDKKRTAKPDTARTGRESGSGSQPGVQ